MSQGKNILQNENDTEVNLLCNKIIFSMDWLLKDWRMHFRINIESSSSNYHHCVARRYNISMMLCDESSTFVETRRKAWVRWPLNFYHSHTGGVLTHEMDEINVHFVPAPPEVEKMGNKVFGFDFYQTSLSKSKLTSISMDLTTTWS